MRDNYKIRLPWLRLAVTVHFLWLSGRLFAQSDILTIHSTIVTFASPSDKLYLNGTLINQVDATNNGNIRMSTNAELILKGDLVNNVLGKAVITSTSLGGFRFSGANPQFISGNGLHRYHKLMVNTGTLGGLTLNADVRVRDSLLMQSGNVALGNHSLDFGGTGILSGETETRRVFSTGTGYLRAIRFTNMAPVNLGGLTTTISSTFDSVAVQRYHNQYLNVADSSILRNVELTVRNASGANAALNFGYLDAERDGIAEVNWVQFSSPDQLIWSNIGGTFNSTANTVAATNIAAPANTPKRYTVTREDCSSNPAVNLGADTTLCFGHTLTLDAGNPGFQFLWSTGATTQTIVVDSATLDTTHLFWVMVTDHRGCRSRDTIGVHGGYNLTADLGPDIQECTGVPVTLDLGSGYDQYSWSTGATTQTISVNAGGSYHGSIQNIGLDLPDQNNLGTSSEGSATTAAYQVFSPGGSGELSRIDVGIGPTSASGTLTLTLYADSTANHPVYSGTFSFLAGATNAFVPTQPIRVRANRYYRVALTSATAFKPMQNSSYAPGYSSIPGQDLKFSTRIQYASSCPDRDTVVVTYLPNPAPPTEPDTARCGNGTVTITALPAPGGNNVRWYADSVTTTVLFTGTTFTTPVLGATTSYFITTLTTSGCESPARDRVTVQVNPVPSLSITPTAVACFGATTGALDLTVTSGTPTFAYLWSNSATTEDLSALGAGTYAVTVTDLAGCTATQSATVTQPSGAISSNAIVTDVQCHGQSNGAIDLSVSGGTPGYTYLWSNGATTQDLTALGAGTYTVTITDLQGCTATRTATVATPGAILLSTLAQGVACAGQNTGSIDLTATGGTGLLTYLWSNGATTQDISALAPGPYTVTVTDASGCISVTSDTVQSATSIVLTLAATDASCNGGNNGSIDLTVSGGTPAYTYQWSTAATTQDLTGLQAATYYVTVTDQSGCVAMDSSQVSAPAAISLATTTTNSTCGVTNGSATVTASGGVGGFSYLWPFSGATTATATGFGAGIYTVIVTDGNGCVDSTLASVSDFGAPTLQLDTVIDVTCFGGATGAVLVTTLGGTAPLTYLWTNGDTTEDLTGIVAGLYGLSVTDSSGCIAALNGTVAEPPAITLSLVGQDPACAGGASGNVLAFANGGTPSYTYAWSNAATTQDLLGVVAGTYTLTLTDALGCTLADSATLTDPPGLSTAIIGTDVSCFGLADGAADLTVTGGTPTYTYLWSNGQVSEDANSLVAGSYQVTVTDQAGCSSTDSVTINEPTLLVVADTVTDASCFGQPDGQIAVTVTGGTPSYTYLWNNGDTLEDLSALTIGIYAVTVTDAQGCSSSLVDSIQEPTLLVLGDSVVHIACGGGNTGEIYLSAAGGTPGYAYAWSNGDSTSAILSLSAGIYGVTVTDQQGCTAALTDTLVQPDPIVVADSVQGVTCMDYLDGAIFLSVTGGLPAYTYLWSTGDTTATVGGLAVGSYVVTVTDSRNCSLSDTIEVVGGDSALRAIFIAATYVQAGDSLFFYDLSEPAPTELEWDFGDGDTSTASAPVHVYANDSLADTSAYHVRLIVRNQWCTDSVVKTIYVVNNKYGTEPGLPRDPNAYFMNGTVYPNPNTGAFTVSVALSAVNDVEVSVMDLQGRKLISRKLAGDSHYETEFQLSDVARGVYLVRVHSGRNDKVMRVVIF